MELRLDRSAGTAEKVWESRSRPDIFSAYISSAYRLRNGNTLVNFGISHSDGMSGAIVEAAADGTEVFRLDITAADDPERQPTRYRARGDIATVMGETKI